MPNQYEDRESRTNSEQGSDESRINKKDNKEPVTTASPSEQRTKRPPY